MKARIPKPYRELPQTQREKLTEYAKAVALEAAREQFNNDVRLMTELYIKMNCVLLHDTEGFGERRLNRLIWNHKRLFARQIRMVRDGEQIEYLNKRMAEIFKKDGFPQKFLDDLLGEVDTV